MAYYSTPQPANPGTMSAGQTGKSFTWSASLDSWGFEATHYELRLSIDNGATWGWATTLEFHHAGTPYDVAIAAAFGLVTGRYYQRTCIFRVRGRDQPAAQDPEYSDWGSVSFQLDWHITPSQPAAPSLSKASPYEGETITVTMSRPASYNTQDHNGATNQLTYILWREAIGELARVTAPCTQASAALSLTIGQWTTGLSDLNTYLRVIVRDAESQESPWSANASLTALRFRAPSIVVTSITRQSTQAVVALTVTDTGFGSQSSGRIRKIQRKIDSGSFLDVTNLGSWSGMNNSFTCKLDSGANLDPNARYTLQLKVFNIAPFGTDKESGAYSTVIVEYTPVTWTFNDSATGKGGFAAQAIIVGNDFNAAVDPGWLVAQNGVKVGANSVWHAGNFNPASKSDTGHTHSYLPLSGGTVSGNLSATGTVNASTVSATTVSATTVSASTVTGSGQLNLPSGNGTAYMVAGGGDAAGYSANTISLVCWNGMGFYNPTSGGAYPNAISGYVDFRNGIIDMKGGFRRNGKDVWDETNLVTAQGSVAITSGAWASVSFGRTFPSYPRLALSTTHATSFPKVRAVTTTGCQLCLDGTASGTVYWTAIYTA